MKIELNCQGYDISRQTGELVVLRPQLMLLIAPHKTEEIAEALKKIETFLSQKINLVKSDGSTRCFYCGTKARDESQPSCEACGAPL